MSRRARCIVGGSLAIILAALAAITGAWLVALAASLAGAAFWSLVALSG